jgi:hypothetical protein
VGRVLRSRYRDAIYGEFPLLEEELQKKGMASLIKEISVNLGFLDKYPVDDDAEFGVVTEHLLLLSESGQPENEIGKRFARDHLDVSV